MNEKKAFLAIFFLLLISTLIGSFIWHSFSYKQLSEEKYLASYDNKVFRNQKACFLLAFNLANMPSGWGDIVEPLIVETNNRLIFNDKISLAKNKSQDICIPPSSLVEGDNIVEIFFGEEHLFFHVHKSDELPSDEEESEINFLNSKGRRILVEVKNNSSKGGVYPLAVKLNGTKEKEVIVEVSPKNSKKIEIEFDLKEGKNELEFSFLDAKLIKEIDFKGEKKINFLIGLSLFIILFGFFLIIFLLNYPFFEGLIYSFAGFFFILIVLPWVLNLFSIKLNLYSIFIALTLACIATYIIFGKRKGANKNGQEAIKFIKYFFIFILLLSAIQLFLPSHFNNWNVFYERQSELIVEGNSIPSIDQLSYLGRSFSFVWGYFLFNSSLAFLTGFGNQLLFALIFFLVNSFFFISVIYFARSLQFKMDHSIILYLLIISSLFIFVTVMISPKHILSFAFLLAGTGLLINKKNPIIAGAFIGIASFTQASFLVLFPLTYLIVAKKIELKSMIKAVVSSVIIFMILFVPLFFTVGFPYEVSSSEWGYLIRHSPIDLLVDLGQIISILFILTGIKALIGWRRLSFYSKKLFITAIALVLIQSFVTYRINIVTHIVLGILLFQVFAEQFKEKFFKLLIVVLCLLSILTNMTILSYSTLTAQELNPMSFINSHSDLNENVLSDPFYSHIETYFGKRKVLADLYVEYASGEKLKDTYKFILEEDKSILDKYNISYVLTEKEKIFKTAKQLHYFEEEKEFSFMDKIYSNGLITIHRRCS